MTITELDVLIGSWEITGRSAAAEHDDITGDLTVTPLLDGQLLQLSGSMRVGSSALRSLELIWCDEATPGFAAHVYSGASAPLDYRWDRDGDTLVHAGLGMTYTGTISADGATIIGSWQPDPDRPDMAPAAYDATMRRTA
ncbi:MAG TPA: hypothetical protein VHW44_01285 [Pseudonocardiaceae bacterium]|jgi:hypothetical protein|nr:hypothetical protein [Pseudonocardiaceae bacterium]